jgi:hypothetical protein
MPTWIQPSFSGGEIAPVLYGRSDQAKFQTGLNKCSNWMLQRYGGIINRPGTQFVTEVVDPNDNAIIIPFVFDEDTSYALLCGDQYMRVIKQGALTTVSGLPAYAGGTTYDLGDLVSYGGTNYVSLQDNHAGNQPDISPLFWYAMPGNILEIPTPWAEADLFGLNWAQLGDIIEVSSHQYAPQQIVRFSDTNWGVRKKLFDPAMARPAATAITPVGAGTVTEEYRITAIDAVTAEESLASYQTLDVITTITQANPANVRVNTPTLTYANNDIVLIYTISGMGELEKREFTIANVTVVGPDVFFDLVNEDSSAYGAFTSGTVTIVGNRATGNAPAPAAGAWTINWSEVSGASEYNIYKLDATGRYGFIGTVLQSLTGTGAFSDTGITPDTSITPPIQFNPFFAAGRYPRYVAFGQQRLWYANTLNEPEKIWASQIGLFGSFATSPDVLDSDGFSFVINSERMFEVRGLLELGTMVVFTAGAEWALLGGTTGTVTPTGINANAQSYYGSSTIRPVPVSGSAVYVQARKRIVRDLFRTLDEYGYEGRDISVFAPHFFEGQDETVSRLAFQENPNSIVWAVMENGDLRGLTYVPEHEVWGWHRHSSGLDAKFRDVAVIPEVFTMVPDNATITDDFLYVIVERTVNGSLVKYVERLASRRLSNQIREMKFLDSGLSFNGTNLTTAGYDTAATATLTTGAGWTVNDTLTLTMSANTFVAGDVGNGMWLTGADGSRVFVTFTAYTSPTVVSCKPDRTVPASLQSTATTTWGKAVDQVAGLDHLEGEEVWVLADGFVVTPQTVSSGSITLAQPYVIIHVGLQYNSDAVTLRPEVGQGTILHREKLIKEAHMLVADTRGLFVGYDTGDADDLYEIKPLDDGDPDDPIALRTARFDIQIRSQWDDSGFILIRQRDPLPANVLDIAPSGMIGGN